MLRTALYADPHNLFLHDLVLESCRKHAHKTALVDASSGRRLTYAEYGETVESLARGLITAGVKPGDVVAIFLANSWEFCTAYHATTLAGAIPTLLNPTYREREVRYQLENSGAVILITDGAHLEGIDLGGLLMLRRVYTTRQSAPGSEPFANLMTSTSAAYPKPDRSSEETLAALPYSSGTTGLPKGVMLSHFNLVANVYQLCGPNATKLNSADTILWRKVQVGKTAVQIALDNGRLNLRLADMALYQGDVKGSVQVDGSNPVLSTTANLKIDKVQVGPLLKALEDSDRVTGAAMVDTQLTSHGKSQKELIGALNGKGSLALQNGVVKGIDLVGLVKDAAASVTGGNGGETDFTTANGTYTIANGILTNKDLNVSAPTLGATGAGTVNLPARTIDYKLSTKLASTVAVPVNVKGPWDNISWGVDVAGMAVQNVGNAANLVGSGVKGVGSVAGGAATGAGGALKKLLGN